MKIDFVDGNDEIFDSIEIPDDTSMDVPENQGGFLDGYGFDLRALINARDFEKRALLQTAADAVSSTIEEKKTMHPDSFAYRRSFLCKGTPSVLFEEALIRNQQCAARECS